MLLRRKERKMDKKRYKPLVDKLFFIIFIPTFILIASFTVIPAIFAPKTLFITVPILLFTLYFLISPLFGYAELREDGLFIKYGFFLKKFIPYNKIRSVEKKKKFYSESFMSLKHSFEHLDIKYNSFDVTSISVKYNDEFTESLNAAKNKNAESKSA